LSFDLAWLDLRESADRAARDATLLQCAAAYLARFDDPLAVDLGAGSGAMMRALPSPDLSWRLVDHDEALVREAGRRSGGRAAIFSLDLVAVDELPLDGANLVTASALLDLAGQSWIGRLARRVGEVGAGLYATLSYDGSLLWTPGDADDEAVRLAFNEHQTRDKGLGPALGPAGWAWLAQALASQGYDVRAAPSPWMLDGSSEPLLRQLVEGIAAAAMEGGEAAAPGWLQRRLAATSELACRVGHVDLLALPPTATNSQSKMMSVPRP